MYHNNRLTFHLSADYSSIPRVVMSMLVCQAHSCSAQGHVDPPDHSLQDLSATCTREQTLFADLSSGFKAWGR